MATLTHKSLDRLRVLRQTAGWILLGLGLLTVGYSVWAFAGSRAYLDEFQASGQVIEPFDAANYLMSSSGLYLLVGVLLTAHGGRYLTRPQNSPERQDHPAAPTTSNKPPKSTPTRQLSESKEEDELDELLRRVDGNP